MNPWVYNRSTDLSVFGGAMLLALVLSLLFPTPVILGSMFVYVFIDITHSITTYFFTLNSDRINNSHHRFFFRGIPFLVYGLICAMIASGLYSLLFKIYALASVYHFMKQTQAWIVISGKKTRPKSRFEDNLNLCMSYCAVWAPQIISMTLDTPTFWFFPGDILKLPTFFKDATLGLSGLVLLTYGVVEVKRWHETRLILWGKHFHIIAGFLVWASARLFILAPVSATLGQFLMICTHSFSYLYLAHRYIKTRRAKHENFWPNIKHHYLFLLWIICCCMIVTTSEHLYIYQVKQKNLYVLGIIFTIALTHYIYDAYMWKKDTHPEGAEILST
jgi:hypothetical protein